MTLYNCSGLMSVTIPASVTSIEWWAFRGCSGLESISVAAGNKVYDSREDCNAIIEKESNKLICGCKSTVIPASVTSIGESAFRDCSALTGIIIPESVTSIGDKAFDGCDNLTIYSSAASYAKKYAEENNIPFKLISEMGNADKEADNSLNSVKASSAGAEGSNTNNNNQNAGGTGNSSTNRDTGSITDNSAGNVTEDKNEPPTVSKVKGFKVTQKKKSLKLKWKKARGIKRYELQYSLNKDFSGAEKINISKSKTSYTIKKLKPKEKYYVRIRAIKTYRDAGNMIKTILGLWVTKNKKTK